MAAGEAMAAGLPVVMTDVGLANEVITHGEHGLVARVGDMHEFLGAVQLLYEDPGMRKKIADAGYAAVAAALPKTRDHSVALYRESFKQCLAS